LALESAQLIQKMNISYKDKETLLTILLLASNKIIPPDRVEELERIIRDMTGLTYYEKAYNDGLNKGLKEGLKEGKDKGLKEGEDKGRRDMAKKLAKVMLQQFPASQVSKETGLSLAELETLKPKSAI
jgi:flagellar biosynthesis/type III secretory pathway protein FliH